MRTRLLHVISTLEIGGEQTYLVRLANRLDRDRFEQVVAFAGDNALEQDFARDVRLVCLSRDKVTATRPKSWTVAARFARLILKERIDLVTTHGAGWPQIAASLAGRSLRRPVVHTIQRPYGNRSRTEDWTIRTPVLRQAVYSLTDRFVALGSYYARDQAVRWRIPERKITLNYIGIDLASFRPGAAAAAEVRRELGLDPLAPTLGIVARHNPVKGVNRGLDSFARVHRRLPGARLILVGDGPSRADHERHARELGITGAVIFLGARRDAPRVLSGFDVVLQTTYNPLNGISSIEGLAAGRAIVTVVDTLEEELMAADTCEEGRNGLYFRTRDPETSAELLSALLSNRAEIARMGEESRCIAEERFEIDRHVRSLEDLYETLTKNARS